jgi:hypothetical protein
MRGKFKNIHQVPMVEGAFNASGIGVNFGLEIDVAVARFFKDDDVFHDEKIWPKKLGNGENVANGNEVGDVAFDAKFW